MLRNTLQSLLLRWRSSGLSAVFSLRKPRNPLLRLVLGLAGIALLTVLLVFGVVIGMAMLAAKLIAHPFRARNRATAGQARGKTIDGDYRVVDKPLLR